jgi:hypothetical protein
LYVFFPGNVLITFRGRRCTIYFGIGICLILIGSDICIRTISDWLSSWVI